MLLEHINGADMPEPSATLLLPDDGAKAVLSTTGLATQAVPKLWAAAAGGDVAIIDMVLGQEKSRGSSQAVAVALNEKEAMLGKLRAASPSACTLFTPCP